ncbi:uncharacterized protein [Elaeis guineensis]|uniref:uncharacterized protein n=1 Tax=Elaeis guineensis var. tenera TaxID=51953 RepID=UPI003C6D9D96
MSFVWVVYAVLHDEMLYKILGRLKGKATEAFALGLRPQEAPRSLASGIAVQPPPPASQSRLQALHTPSVTASLHLDPTSDVPIPPPSPVVVQPPPPRLHLRPSGIPPSRSRLHAPSVTASAHPSVPIPPPPPYLHLRCPSPAPPPSPRSMAPPVPVSPARQGLPNRQGKTTRSQEVRRSSRPGPPRLVGFTPRSTRSPQVSPSRSVRE